MTDETPIQRLRGLGPASVKRLQATGIRSIEQLRDLGPAFVYVTAKRSNRAVSLNLLWAMAAGLQDRHWRSLCDEEKRALIKQVQELER